MLSCEEEKKKRPTQQQQQSAIFFTPRQVILSNPTMKHQLQQQKLTSDQRVLLYQSISHFLELNGFLKSLSKFRKETHLEKDSWKSCSFKLEEIFQEYLQKCSNDKANVPNGKQKDESNHDVSAEIVKGAKENEADDGKKSNAELENNSVSVDAKSKRKKKKESKDIDSSKNLNGETNLKENDHLVEDVKKSKDKKKKHKDKSEPLEKELVEKRAEKENAVPQKEKSKRKKSKEETLVEDEAEKEQKSSKKRKKSSSEDNDNDDTEETKTDDSKRRKTDDSAQLNGAEQTTKMSNGGSAKGVLENGSGKKSEKLNKTKECNDSAEQKSINAFRRVKADEVEFADERLQDNSYWAKDGADSGYGAKAQEVLGQVRGRDFRHEKTKKKRGSYRGGQIDLQSHSIKFNYDDDDE